MEEMCFDETKTESAIANASAQRGVICWNGLDARDRRGVG
jgi:hypothetical protein